MTFGPVFARNARWSRVKPVPSLGDADLEIDKVLRFYTFWRGLSSWREFSHPDEYDVQQAEGRGEKRYMERENRRLKAALYKAESERLQKLVALAEAHDPRLHRHVALQEEERIRKREEIRREREARKQEEKERVESLRRHEEDERQAEQRRKEEEEQAREIARKGRKQAEQQFRCVFLSRIISKRHDNFYLDEIVPRLKTEAMLQLSEQLANGTISEVEHFEAELRSHVAPQQHAPAPSLTASRSDEQIKWSEELISLLAKGVIRFPPGTQNRWARVSQYIGGEFTEAQVAAKAMEIKQNPGKPREAPQQSEVWSQEQQLQLEQAIKRHRACSPRTKWERISADVPGRSPKECIERFKHLRDKLAARKKD